jgi:predicted O-linked N-acetylglucosamine transferase (SPINDLY family)
VLAALDLNAWVADDLPAYVATAASLAADLKRLVELRQTLRGRMRTTPVADLPRYSAAVEAAYRRMYEELRCSRAS